MDESNSIARSGEEFDISSANSNSVAILILSLCNLPTLQCGHNLLCHSSAQIFYGHTFVKPRYAPKNGRSIRKSRDQDLRRDDNKAENGGCGSKGRSERA